MIAAKKRIRALEKRDEDKLKDDVAKNDYESTIFEFRGWLHEDEHSVYILESEKDDHLEKLTEAEDWLFDNDDAGYKEFQTRTYELSSTFYKYKGRKDIFQEREQIVPKIFKGIQKWKNEIMDLTENKPWITDDEKNDVLEKMNDMNSWLEEKVKEQAEKKLTDDAVITAKDIDAKFKPVEKLYKKVTDKKKPKEVKKKKEKLNKLDDEKKEGDEDNEKKEEKKEEKSEEKAEEKADEEK